MKHFVIGIGLGIATWIILATISCSIYYAYGMIDVLLSNVVTWGISVTLFNIALDNFIISKLLYK